MTQIDLNPAPFIIKTPSDPIALVAPSPWLAAIGRREQTQDGKTNISRFYDASNVMNDFAVAPQASKIRAVLLAELTAPNVEVNG